MNNILNDGNPCKECKEPKRSPGCHAICDERKEWLEHWQEKKDKINKGRQREELFIELSKHRKCKNIDKRRKK